MIFLDAAGLLALLFDEPGADDVDAILREGGVGMTAVNYAEVIDQAVRVQGVALRGLDRVVQPLLDGGLVAITQVSAEAGRRAGEIRARRYDRARAPVSLGDCVLLGAAAVQAGVVATCDQPLCDVARAEGLIVRPLRNSRGVRPGVSR